ncbi:hypothetical protein CEXT_306621 [Caerostris extrusa]|uniref:Uncharacterized protein n=1 Tax=Caerostris extrusa TaxID=172846 RepID=A0AAV4PKW8_CAEEX|nr:hypothetical protein CEXT_306621 [Caerostris extrusa]
MAKASREEKNFTPSEVADNERLQAHEKENTFFILHLISIEERDLLRRKSSHVESLEINLLIIRINCKKNRLNYCSKSCSNTVIQLRTLASAVKCFIKCAGHDKDILREHLRFH